MICSLFPPINSVGCSVAFEIDMRRLQRGHLTSTRLKTPLNSSLLQFLQRTSCIFDHQHTLIEVILLRLLVGGVYYIIIDRQHRSINALSIGDIVSFGRFGPFNIRGFAGVYTVQQYAVFFPCRQQRGFVIGSNVEVNRVLQRGYCSSSNSQQP